MPWNVWNITEQRWMMLRSKRSAKGAQEALDEVFKPQHPECAFEVKRIRAVLEQHGTTLMQFKPDSIWRMAMQDFDRRSGNRTAEVNEMKQYHFHRDHVRGATTANDILRAAIADLEKGRESGKKITRLLYADADLLKKALQ